MQLMKSNPLGIVFLAAALIAPAWGANPTLPASSYPTSGQTQPASVQPGMINYIEGQVSVGYQRLNSDSVGSAELKSGQVLTTRNGKAEVLLTPGVFLRVGSNSEVRMISPGLADTEVKLDRGRAAVEVDEIHRENNLHVAEDGSTTRLLKTGLYGFSANPQEVQVFKGEARVRDGDHSVKVKGGHQVILGTGKLHSRKFDKKVAEEAALYRFSKLRSDYLAEANARTVNTYVYDGWYGPDWWYGSGWYWTPWLSAYTFIPGNGILYSPFGWGFYSPVAFYNGGYVYGPSFRHEVGFRNLRDRDIHANPVVRERETARPEWHASRPEAAETHEHMSRDFDRMPGGFRGGTSAHVDRH